MKTHARVVVIGGGVVGVSTLYHLAKKGWSDVTLLERTELTAGSTWHAAGLLPLFNMSYTVGQLHKYSVDLYKRLPEETGQEVSFHVTGNLRLATSRDRMDEYYKYCGTANTIGVPFRVISPAEVKALWPLVNLGDGVDTPKIVGALYHPDDGHIAPVDLTMALRQGRARGRRRDLRADRSAKRRAHGVGRMEDHDQRGRHHLRARRLRDRQLRARDRPEVRPRACRRFPSSTSTSSTTNPPSSRRTATSGGRELAVLRESDASYYLREERLGWILGPYERGAPARFADGVPRAVRQGALPGRSRSAAAARRGGDEARAVPRALRHQDDRQRADLLHAGRQPADRSRCGACATSGSTRATASASPPPAAPDGSSPNGSSKASPASTCSPSIRAASAAYTGKRYTVRKNEETYRNVFTIHYPDEEREDARPAKTSAVYEKLNQMGAVWGQRYGWERANWFAPPGVDAQGQVELPAQQLLRARRQRMPADARQRGRDRPDAFHQARSERARAPRRGSTRWSRTRCR